MDRSEGRKEGVKRRGKLVIKDRRKIRKEGRNRGCREEWRDGEESGKLREGKKSERRQVPADNMKSDMSQQAQATTGKVYMGRKGGAAACPHFSLLCLH